jgi:hypothetical protein
MPRPIIIRNSERAALKRCPQRWWWSFRNGLVPNEVDTKLWFGEGIHMGLAGWYLPGAERGEHPAKTWAKFVRDEERYIKDNRGLIDDVKWIDARDLGMAMLIGYVDEYGDDPDWDVVATEQTFQIKSRTDSGVEFTLSGTFDGVLRLRSTGKLMLMEHKTAASIPDFGYLELDNQASTYFTAAEIWLKATGVMREDEHLDGILYNFLRKSLPDDRPVNDEGYSLNKNGSVSKNQPAKLFARHEVWRSQRHRVRTLEQIKAEVELMQMYRNRQLKITKTPTKDCAWDCDFYRMCQLHESGDDWTEYRDAMYSVRDPYDDHRLAMKSS